MGDFISGIQCRAEVMEYLVYCVRMRMRGFIKNPEAHSTEITNKELEIVRKYCDRVFAIPTDFKQRFIDEMLEGIKKIFNEEIKRS